MAKLGRPRIWKEHQAEEFFLSTEEYFNINQAPYFISGLCLHLGITEDTLTNYEAYKDFFGTIKQARLLIKHSIEVGSCNSKNPAGYIFNLKCNHGMSEKQADININLGGQDANPVAVNHQTMSPEQLEVYKQAARKLAELSTQ